MKGDHRQLRDQAVSGLEGAVVLPSDQMAKHPVDNGPDVAVAVFVVLQDLGCLIVGDYPMAGSEATAADGDPNIAAGRYVAVPVSSWTPTGQDDNFALTVPLHDLEHSLVPASTAAATMLEENEPVSEHPPQTPAVQADGGAEQPTHPRALPVDHGPILPSERGVMPERTGTGRLGPQDAPQSRRSGAGRRLDVGDVMRRVTTLRDVADLPFDAVEREQLCDLLDELGPEATTLLDPWTTSDLAAHLFLREHDLVAAPGLVVPGGWARFAERRRLVLKATGFTDLVASIRSGPPPGLFRLGWVRRVANLNEFFVHHEDVRRANGLDRRTLPRAEDEALFRNVTRARWFLSRRLHGVGLELAWDGADHLIRARRGQPTACVRGLPGELLLFLFGRKDASEVRITGSREAVEGVRRTPFGM